MGAAPGTIPGVVALVWIDVIGLIGIIVACGGLYYLSSRIEPHWVSKDRSRFLTVAQDLDDRGLPIGRRRDVRVNIDDESDALLVSKRSMFRPSSAMYTVKSRSTQGKRNVYVLKPVAQAAGGRRDAADAAFLALRVPQTSKVVARLDELLLLTGDDAEMRRERQRYQSEFGPPPAATGASGSPGSPPPDQPTDRG